MFLLERTVFGFIGNYEIPKITGVVRSGHRNLRSPESGPKRHLFIHSAKFDEYFMLRASLNSSLRRINTPYVELYCSMASAIYILDNRGKVLIGRSYRGDVDNSKASDGGGGAPIIERFMPAFLELEEENALTPLIRIDIHAAASITFCYVKHNGLYFVAATRKSDAHVHGSDHRS